MPRSRTRSSSSVKERVLAGMGLIVLHSGHYSKIFKSLMGTSCSLKWREEGENERIWIVNPGHAIVARPARVHRSSSTKRCTASCSISRRRTNC